jgi:hypothetical protein
MKPTKRFQLNYAYTSKDTGDSILEVGVAWDNPLNDDVTADRINAWLTAIGSGLEVVEKTKK